MIACLNADAKTANAGGVPERSFWFRKGFDKTTEHPYSGIRSPGIFSNFKMRALPPVLSPYVEHNCLPAKACYKWLKIAR
jgi:hypothetical protein